MRRPLGNLIGEPDHLRPASATSLLSLAFAAAAALAVLAAPARALADDPPLVPPPDNAPSGGGDDDEDSAYRWYGLGAGVATQLAPADEVGGWVQASAAIDLSPGRGAALLGARGTIGALFHQGGWAVMPLLSADAGLSLGRLDLFLSGGVQIFGFARRADFTAFTSFGLLGGGGFSLRVSKRFRVALRVQAIWLPSGAAAKVDAADETAKPTFLYLSGGLVFELRQLFKEGF